MNLSPNKKHLSFKTFHKKYRILFFFPIVRYENFPWHIISLENNKSTWLLFKPIKPVKWMKNPEEQNMKVNLLMLIKQDLFAVSSQAFFIHEISIRFVIITELISFQEEDWRLLIMFSIIMLFGCLRRGNFLLCWLSLKNKLP